MFDVDGTICFDGQTIEAPIVEALRRLRERTRLVFASARPIRDLLPVLPGDLHDTALIGGNGAFSRVDGELQVLGLSDADRAAIDDILDAHQIGALIDGDWDYSFTGDEQHQIFRQLDAGGLAHNVDRSQIETYSKVALFTTDAAVVDALSTIGLAFSIHPDQGFIDVAPSGITKHHALNRLGIEDGSYVAFGNDANDVPMLEHAARSYCVGKHPALENADHHIGPEDVAPAILDLA